MVGELYLNREMLEGMNKNALDGSALKSLLRKTKWHYRVLVFLSN